MNQRKLNQLKRRLDDLRGAPRKSKVLARMAEALGRKRVKHGSYTWESEVFPHLRPLSIPQHSADVKRFTAESILDHLESEDVYAWQEAIDNEEHNGEGDDDG